MSPFDVDAVAEVLMSIVGVSDALDWFIAFVARYSPFVVGALAIAAIVKERRWRMRVWATALTLLTLILSRGIIAPLIHLAVPRPRPFEVLGIESLVHADPGSAFPSGHASLLFAIAFAVLFYRRSWGWWLVGLSLLNGAARVAGGVHWVGDILGGLAVAAASALVIHALIGRYRPASAPPEPAAAPPLAKE